MKKLVALGLLLLSGCAVQRTFYVRDDKGNLKGPILVRPGSHFELGYDHFMIDGPRPGELETLALMKRTRLPYVSFSNTPLSEVSTTLYSLQQREIGDAAIRVYFAPDMSTNDTHSAAPLPPTSASVNDPFADDLTSRPDPPTDVSRISFHGKYVSLKEIISILGSVTGRSYMDVGDGIVTMRSRLPQSVRPSVCPVSNPIDAETVQQFQAALDRVAQIIDSVETPAYLRLGKSDQRRFAGEFDVMAYFDVFTNITMQSGYILDYVVIQRGLGSNPSLYARRAGSEPFSQPAPLYARRALSRTNAVADVTRQFNAWRDAYLDPGAAVDAEERAFEYLCACVRAASMEHRHEYLDHVQALRTPVGCLELIALRLLSAQFYLEWHSCYDDRRFVCTDAALGRVVNDPEVAGNLDDRDRFILASIDPTPTMKTVAGDVHLSVVTFSKWGGLWRQAYTISKAFPHEITEGGEEVLRYHNCGGVY